MAPDAVSPVTLDPDTLGPEAVRLVVWDLDETFWRGTLTEGGIEHVAAHEAIVRTLAERGIVSAICSKNDLAPVRDVLSERGLWDSFVFPSVDWTSKGPRLAAMIEAIGLRPPTVLFIDDNPMNRAEARHFVPGGIQVASEAVIPALLDHALLRGKDDRGLTRLAQYKLLERRADDQARVGDTAAFLRSSNIRVSIVHDVSGHLDRVIELINRTNQLNFTKRRLPEDAEQARTELTAYLDSWKRQVGLVRVVDDYGDYGFCGFYSFNSHMNRLEHFCFSCRTLGMGVESWLYNRLGRPLLEVAGEVLSDVKADQHRGIDWISVADSLDATAAAPPRLNQIYMRGACDLTTVGHYLALAAREVVGEYTLGVGGRAMRIDHSAFLRYAAEPPDEAGREALAALGYGPDILRSRFRECATTADAVVFAFPGDTNLALYRDRKTGVVVPFHINRQGVNNTTLDLTRSAPEEIARLVGPDDVAAVRRLQADFDYLGPSTKAQFAENLRAGLACVPADTPVIISVLLEQRASARGVMPIDAHIRVNAWIREIAAAYPNVHLLDYATCLDDPSPRTDPVHFDRKTYFRIHERVLEIVEAFQARLRLAA